MSLHVVNRWPPPCRALFSTSRREALYLPQGINGSGMAVTPTFLGRMATILPGVRPGIISLHILRQTPCSSRSFISRSHHRTLFKHEAFVFHVDKIWPCQGRLQDHETKARILTLENDFWFPLVKETLKRYSIYKCFIDV